MLIDLILLVRLALVFFSTWLYVMNDTLVSNLLQDTLFFIGGLIQVFIIRRPMILHSRLMLLLLLLFLTELVVWQDDISFMSIVYLIRGVVVRYIASHLIYSMPKHDARFQLISLAVLFIFATLFPLLAGLFYFAFGGLVAFYLSNTDMFDDHSNLTWLQGQTVGWPLIMTCRTMWHVVIWTSDVNRPGELIGMYATDFEQLIFWISFLSVAFVIVAVILRKPQRPSRQNKS